MLYSFVVDVVVVVVVVVDMDRKRKDQLLEALFRASLDEASRLEMKGRPARKAGSASIGNKNKTHKRPSKVVEQHSLDR